MSTLITNVEKYVIELLTNQLNSSFIYHNLAHTQYVVEKVNEFIEETSLDEKTAEKLLIAAWFHDTGYIKGFESHEEESVKIAEDFLKKQNISENLITEITELILATKMGVLPKSENEKILKDADCAHLGSKNFSEVTILLRKEWELTRNYVLTDFQWLQENSTFLTNHTFYTDVATKKWAKGKSKNLAQVLKQLKKAEESTVKLKQKKEELRFKKNKVTLPERGIETMFRVTLRNHITLSDIADTKANILLSVNAIIVSLALSNLLPKLDNPSNSYLIIPTVIFVLFTIASMILSVLATRPNVTSGKFSKKDVEQKKVNLLFFGNFYKMRLEEFEWAMGEMMQDRDYLYSSMKKDLYFLGLVLNKKYKILRVTYTVFMIGIIVSVLAFAISFKMSLSSF